MSSSSAVTPRSPLGCLWPNTMLGKGAGIRESGDYDRLKHQLNSAILGTREQYALESCTFTIIFCSPKFMLLWGGMETTFPHHFQAFPFSFLGPELLPLVWSCSGKIHVLALLARMALVRLSWGWVRPVGQCWVALPRHWQPALHAGLKPFVLSEALPEWQSSSWTTWATVLALGLNFPLNLKRQGTINWQNKLLNVCKWTANTPTSVISFR